jgi:hypothetical protein
MIGGFGRSGNTARGRHATHTRCLSDEDVSGRAVVDQTNERPSTRRFAASTYKGAVNPSGPGLSFSNVPVDETRPGMLHTVDSLLRTASGSALKTGS